MQLNTFLFSYINNQTRGLLLLVALTLSDLNFSLLPMLLRTFVALRFNFLPSDPFFLVANMGPRISFLDLHF